MKEKIWCLYLELSENMWNDSPTIPWCSGEVFEEELKTDKKTWDEIIDFAAAHGVNTLMIDVGDAILYKSHPEISVKGAWTPEFANAEVKHLKAMGLRLIPCLNFSAGHDAWLGVYSRMLSTPTYYEVVRDIIHEVIDIFDTPEFLHIGFDEENALNQQRLTYACYRQADLIWHDINYCCDCVREKGVRPFMDADLSWSHYDEFIKNIPRDVVIGPWYYGHMYPDAQAPLPTDEWNVARRENYKKLSDEGYDMLVQASNITAYYNIEHNLRFSLENIAPEHFLGMMFAAWRPTRPRHKYAHMDVIYLAEEVKEQYKKHLQID